MKGTITRWFLDHPRVLRLAIALTVLLVYGVGTAAAGHDPGGGCETACMAVEHADNGKSGDVAYTILESQCGG